MPTRPTSATALAAVVPAQPYEPIKLDGWSCEGEATPRRKSGSAENQEDKWEGQEKIILSDQLRGPLSSSSKAPHLRAGEAAQDEVGERDEENRRSEATEQPQRLQWPRRWPALR